MGKSGSLPSSGHYNSNYGNFQTEIYGEIRREAFGKDIGQNSWHTSEEQDRFLDWLDLSPAKTLLDVGCGAGGPALRVAATTGCSVVGIDIHEPAIAAATSLPRSVAWPNAPNSNQWTLLHSCHFLTTASTLSPVLMQSTTFPIGHASLPSAAVY